MTAPSEKRQAILATLRAIPKGHVTSYGEVAKRAGLPGYARIAMRRAQCMGRVELVNA